MISNRCARKSLVTNCNSIISKNYLRFLVDSNVVDGNKIDDYPELKEIIKRQCGPMYKNYIDSHKAQYDGFDDFLNAAGIK